jgi:putative transposase
LVFVAKHRRLVFDKAALDTLKGIFSGICAKFEATLVEMDGERASLIAASFATATSTKS